jgi:copper chaperone CopZ
VKSASVSLEQKQAEVTFEPALADVGKMKAAIENAGFEAP